MSTYEKSQDGQKVWPEIPTEEAVGELAGLFEAECLAQGEDPRAKSETLGLTSFLLHQDFGSNIEDYRMKIIEEIEKRYPDGQQEML